MHNDMARTQVTVEVRLRVPDDQAHHLPSRARWPDCLPGNAPLPRQGDLIYLSSTSAWGVEAVIHEWRTPQDLRIEVWLHHLGATHHTTRPDFATTQ